MDFLSACRMLLFPVQMLYHVVKASVSSLMPSRRKDLSREVVLITGGGRGIGRHLAKEFVKQGARKVRITIHATLISHRSSFFVLLVALCKSFSRLILAAAWCRAKVRFPNDPIAQNQEWLTLDSSSGWTFLSHRVMWNISPSSKSCKPYLYSSISPGCKVLKVARVYSWFFI